MINKVKLAEIQNQTDTRITTPDAPMSRVELVKLRKEIDAILGEDPTSISQLNLESELLEQYTKTKGLMDEVLTDPEVAANQKAQVANAVVSTLGQIVKMQEDLRKEESLKIMEACLIDSIKVLPDETKALFFSEYETRARKAGLL